MEPTHLSPPQEIWEFRFGGRGKAPVIMHVRDASGAMRTLSVMYNMRYAFGVVSKTDSSHVVVDAKEVGISLDIYHRGFQHAVDNMQYWYEGDAFHFMPTESALMSWYVSDKNTLTYDELVDAARFLVLAGNPDAVFFLTWVNDLNDLPEGA